MRDQGTRDEIDWLGVTRRCAEIIRRQRAIAVLLQRHNGTEGHDPGDEDRK